MLVGGGILSLSLFSGVDKDLDADSDFDFDAAGFDADTDVDADGDADSEGSFAGSLDGWLPLRSVRFWTNFLAFGGATGLSLTLLGNGVIPVAVVAAIIGYSSGLIASRLIRKLRKDRIGTSVDAPELVGKSGSVLLPLGADRRGKIRIEVGGRTLDLIAQSGGESLQEGQPILIYDVDDNGVASVSSVYSEDA